MVKSKLWNGRFNRSIAPIVESFTQSISFDKRLAPYDIQASMAHVRMLAKGRIVKRAEAGKIIKGLEKILSLIKSQRFIFKQEHEDIHMHIESFLIHLVGEAGKKLHTGRSRNDQVLVDVHLYLKDVVQDVLRHLDRFQKVLLKCAEGNLGLIIPGYTHLQQAQPVLASHYFLSYFFKVQRDKERFSRNLHSLDVLPLGAGALAGVNYAIDRHYVARLLGFSRVSENSMDTVSNRDALAEFLFNSALTAVHLSQLAEDLIIWNSQEFGLIEIDDAFTTGSSIMPNKKNPDVLELVRGRTAHLVGALGSLLTLLKGLPLTYNRDLQEDKVILFHALDTFMPLLAIIPELISHIRFNQVQIKEKMRSGFMLATDIADYLVKKGVAFRTAHHIAGRAVRYCVNHHKTLFDLTLEEWKKLYKHFNKDIFSLLDYRRSVNGKLSYGGTSLKSVRIQLGMARKMVRA